MDQTQTETQTETPLSDSCSRCMKPLDTTGYPKWCKACRAKNQREYQALRAQMGESRGFNAGVSAMREFLAEQFSKYGPAQSWTGPSIAKIIRECQGPPLPISDQLP